MALIISPPFGNYISLPFATSIKGSFTLYPREGKWKQIFKTLRYSFLYNGWVNKIGLRNPGIDYAIKKYKNTNHIISVAILDQKEIPELHNRIPENMNLELNLSCPNAEHDMVSDNIDCFLNNKRKWCIVKLSPVDDIKRVDRLYKNGFRQFHCSNTMPTKLLKTPTYPGGLSGPYLIPYTKKLVKEIKDKYPDTTIIAGGGIRNMDTLNLYKKNGADFFSVSSLLFNPIRFGIFYFNYLKTK